MSAASPTMEIFVEIHENVRGEDVFVIQSTSFPPTTT
jgi:phosphoribosylpyrophosphate synthetase